MFFYFIKCFFSKVKSEYPKTYKIGAKEKGKRIIKSSPVWNGYAEEEIFIGDDKCISNTQDIARQDFIGIFTKSESTRR